MTSQYAMSDVHHDVDKPLASYIFEIIKVWSKKLHGQCNESKYVFFSEPTHNFFDQPRNQEASPQGQTTLKGGEPSLFYYMTFVNVYLGRQSGEGSH